MLMKNSIKINKDSNNIYFELKNQGSYPACNHLLPEKGK